MVILCCYIPTRFSMGSSIELSIKDLSNIFVYKGATVVSFPRCVSLCDSSLLFLVKVLQSIYL